MSSQSHGQMGVSAKELLRRETSDAYRPIPTFVQSLDKILVGGEELEFGGVKTGLITELVGDCGIGKTTFCIQLCINVQAPQFLRGPEAEAIFIDTENSFVANRVTDMAKEFVRHCNFILKKEASKLERLTEEKVMDGIHVIQCIDVDEFEKVILGLENYLKENRKIRLIVIDSIAFPYYSKEEGFWGRNQSLYSIAQVLHYLAATYDISVVITNNLTTRFHPNGDEYFIPFLGDSWHHIPNQRILLQWKGGIRRAQVVKSSCVPVTEVSYKVTGVGIRE